KLLQSRARKKKGVRGRRPRAHRATQETKGTQLRAVHTLRRYWLLLARYLRPQWPRMVVLALVLCATIAVQVAAPLVAGRFIDRATGGGPLDQLISLALLAVGLAVLGQGMAVAETYVA